MTYPCINICDLGVTFSKKPGFFFRHPRPYAVRHISVDIKKNETFCLVGESGSGKTTLIRALLGLHPFQEGSVTFDGRIIKKNAEPAYQQFPNRMQLVFQDPSASLSPFLTLRKSMEEALLAQGMNKKERAEIVYKLADQMGLSRQVISRKPSAVSGGQCQRACIVRALSTNPEILFLDEPLAALDTLTQKKVAELLCRIRERCRMTFFLVTHNLRLVKKIGTTVAVMYLGRIVEKAPTEQFFLQPRHPYSQALLSSTLDPYLWNTTRIILKGETSSRHAPSSGCVFYSKCFQRIAECETEPPPKRLVSDKHEVFCHLPHTT